jgi:hypothetical protein
VAAVLLFQKAKVFKSFLRSFQVKSGRFFVTTVILLAMGATVACNRNRANRERSRAELMNEGNAKIAQAQALQKQLAADFGVNITSDSKGLREQTLRGKDLTDKLMCLHVSARRDIQARLAQYLQLINRVIEIDAKNLITIENRDMIFTSRNSAELLQKSIEEFERTHGENFNPKDLRRA